MLCRHIGGEEIWLCSFLACALDGVKLPTSDPGKLYSQERTMVPTEYDAGWAPEPAQTFCKRTLAPTRFQTQIIQPIKRSNNMKVRIRYLSPGM
jgi:hypothetical protein